MKAKNIKWDEDILQTENLLVDSKLPTEIELPSNFCLNNYEDEDALLEAISDWLSEKYQHCHYGFEIAITNDDLEDIICKVDYMNIEQQRKLFVHLQKKFVSKDVKYYADSISVELTEDEAQRITDKYCDEGKYDCNLSYWDNIGNLIRDIKNQ